MLKSKVRNSEKFVIKIQEKLMMSIVPKPRGYRMLFTFWSLFIGSKLRIEQPISGRHSHKILMTRQIFTHHSVGVNMIEMEWKWNVRVSES